MFWDFPNAATLEHTVSPITRRVDLSLTDGRPLLEVALNVIHDLFFFRFLLLPPEALVSREGIVFRNKVIRLWALALTRDLRGLFTRGLKEVISAHLVYVCGKHDGLG